LARPYEYALIYGSPVPGYAAPADTVAPAARVAVVLGGILAEADAAGTLAAGTGARLPAQLRAELKGIGDAIAKGVDERALARGLMAWMHILGAVSFEVYGHLVNTIDERAAWFDHQIRTMVRFVGLGSDGR
jgi:hypothetical protein